MRISGAEAFLTMLADAGVTYLFGNPGTTELPINDALARQSRIQYILGLQEIPVMSMADGYAMASGNLGVVNVHISCGLGNAMGMLYNAYREGTPLLVTAGQQDRRLKFQEPILYGDMVSVARPWTKWAVEVERIEDLPRAIRRAVQVARTPPTGPVFMSLPMDLQMEEAELDLSPAPALDYEVRPPVKAVRAAAALLRAAKNPAILAGSRVIERGAINEVVRLAEHLGAPVYSESMHAHGRLGFPAHHPLYGQTLPLWAPEIHEFLKPYDVLLVVGMDLLREYVYFEPARAIPEHIRIVHLDEDAYQIGKNYPVAVGVLGSIKASLEDVFMQVADITTREHNKQATTREQPHLKRHAAARDVLNKEAENQCGVRPITPLVLMETLGRVLPANVAVIEEAVTTANANFQRLGVLRNVDGYFAHRGWALGWGLGCALGVKLAWPDRPVLCILGEGAAMYGIQGLWSAARYGLGVTFVIANNAQYQILKAGAQSLGLPAARAEKFVGMDLSEPAIDLVGIGRSMGVESQRISEPDELADRTRAAFESGRPQLIDVPIQPSLAGPG